MCSQNGHGLNLINRDVYDNLFTLRGVIWPPALKLQEVVGWEYNLVGYMVEV